MIRRFCQDRHMTSARVAVHLVVASLTSLMLSGCVSGASSSPRWSASDEPGSPGTPGPSVSSVPTSPAAPTEDFVFPVVARTVSYARTHAEYPATDILAACGSPVLAVTPGVVLEVSRVDRFDAEHPDGAEKGGLFVSIRGDDGVRYYGSHLSQLLPGIEAGIRVAAGQRLGSVGRTGHANNVCHLHFGISPPCSGAGDWWIRRGVIWPWSYLDAWRAGKALSAAPAVTAWQRGHGCPAAP
jgi:murein DD-endopeptidase MepM/ murein hydrolase activator NlpD